MSIPTILFDQFASPIGTLTAAVREDDGAVVHILFQENRHDARDRDTWRRDAVAISTAREQLLEYLAGGRREFALQLAPRGTPFQLGVWHALADIPYGSTWNYGELARRVGRPTASRAVGAANGRNPLPIVLPCHRVIGSNGALTGFGGGLPTKAALLELESGMRPSASLLL